MHIDRYGEMEAQKDIWERWLPYAIVFGIEKELSQKFAAINTPTPKWYRPLSPDNGSNQINHGVNSELTRMGEALTAMLNTAESVMGSKPTPEESNDRKHSKSLSSNSGRDRSSRLNRGSGRSRGSGRRRKKSRKRSSNSSHSHDSYWYASDDRRNSSSSWGNWGGSSDSGSSSSGGGGFSGGGSSGGGGGGGGSGDFG